MSGNYTPFKQWQSPLSLEDVFSNIGKPQFLELKQGCLYWMEQNPEIGGVQIKGRQTSGEVFTVTTPKLNVRTKVNEYGGKAFCVGEDAIYFCNNSDQRIYRLPLNHDFYAELAAVVPMMVVCMQICVFQAMVIGCFLSWKPRQSQKIELKLV